MINKENKKYKELLQSVTQESDQVTENAIKHIMNKTATETLNSLASEWSNMDISDKSEIAKEFAGTYQITRFLTLMELLSKKQKGNSGA